MEGSSESLPSEAKKERYRQQPEQYKTELITILRQVYEATRRQDETALKQVRSEANDLLAAWPDGLQLGVTGCESYVDETGREAAPPITFVASAARVVEEGLQLEGLGQEQAIMPFKKSPVVFVYESGAR